MADHLRRGACPVRDRRALRGGGRGSTPQRPLHWQLETRTEALPRAATREVRAGEMSVGEAVSSARKPAREPLGHSSGGSRARCDPRHRRFVRRRGDRGPVSLAVLAVDRERRPDLDRRRDGCAHRLRRHRHRSRRADGDRDVLGSHHAPLVPRRHAEGDARGSRWHPHVLVLGAPTDRRRLRPGRRRDTVRILRLPEPAVLHRLLRSISPKAETGGRRRGCRQCGPLDVRADCALRRSAGDPMGIRDNRARIQHSSCNRTAAAQSRLSIPTVSSGGLAPIAPSSSCRTRSATSCIRVRCWCASTEARSTIVPQRN